MLKVCHSCYLHEMAHRVRMNTYTCGRDKYQVPSWDSLEVVTTIK